MLMLRAKKAYRMHPNAIENQLLIHLKDLYAFGMPVSVIRTEVEAISMKIQAVFPQFLPMDDLHEGSSYVVRHIRSYPGTHTHITSPNYISSFNLILIVVSKQTYLTSFTLHRASGPDPSRDHGVVGTTSIDTSLRRFHPGVNGSLYCANVTVLPSFTP